MSTVAMSYFRLFKIIQDVMVIDVSNIFNADNIVALIVSESTLKFNPIIVKCLFCVLEFIWFTIPDSPSGQTDQLTLI